MKLDRNTLNQIIKTKINETINFYVGRHIQDDACALEIALGNIEAMIDNAKSALAQGSEAFYLADEVRQFAETMGIKVDDDQVKLLAHHMTHAHLKGLHRSKEILENGEPWLPGDGENGPQDEPRPPVSKPGPPSITLQELVTQYTKHQLSTGSWRKNSARNAEPQLKALLSYFKPDTPVRPESSGMHIRLISCMRYSIQSGTCGG